MTTIILMVFGACLITALVFWYFNQKIIKGLLISIGIYMVVAVLIVVAEITGLFKNYENPYFVINNVSEDTITVEFYKDMRTIGYYNQNNSTNDFCFSSGKCIDYASFVLGELKLSGDKKMPKILSLTESKYPIGYNNKKNVFYKYIKDSVWIRELIYDRNFFVGDFSNINELMFIMDSNNESNPLLKLTPNEYYNGDTSKYEKILSGIISIYLPPKNLFVKREMAQHNKDLPIEESFPIASKLIVLARGKVLCSIDRNNFKKIMQKKEFYNEEGSYVLEINNRMLVN